jgi:hypothetical protein
LLHASEWPKRLSSSLPTRRSRRREFVDLLDGTAGMTKVIVVRFERWLRARWFDDAADRVV